MRPNDGVTRPIVCRRRSRGRRASALVASNPNALPGRGQSGRPSPGPEPAQLDVVIARGTSRRSSTPTTGMASRVTGAVFEPPRRRATGPRRLTGHKAASIASLCTTMVPGGPAHRPESAHQSPTPQTSRQPECNPLGVRAALRHAVDMCRDVHRQHSDQKAAENLKSRVATRRCVDVIRHNEQ